ncbi:13033_t:CDS:2 [Entrophospora sp. SA101]|nr:13033_t:CDS:2 [Entrophospora sp. SA101]
MSAVLTMVMFVKIVSGSNTLTDIVTTRLDGGEYGISNTKYSINNISESGGDKAVDNIVSEFGDNAIGNIYNNYNVHLSNDDDNYLGSSGSIIDDSSTKEIKGQLKIDVEDDDITVTVNGDFFEIVLTFPEK